MPKSKIKKYTPNEKKLIEILKQGKIAWKWFKKYTPYKKDYDKYSSIKNVSDDTQKQLREKWGFFPLLSPNEKVVPFEFLCQFMEFNPPVVYLENLKIDKSDCNSYYPTRTSSKTKITFELNLRIPTGTIKEEISKIIERIKSENNINDIEPRYSDLALLYKKCVQERINSDLNKIKNVIKNPNRNTTPEEKAAERKRTARILKKFQATSF